jgi:hypothetical protein
VSCCVGVRDERSGRAGNKEGKGTMTHKLGWKPAIL